MMKKKKRFFTDGQLKELKSEKIDPDDEYFKELMARTKAAQEKNEQLKKIDPKMGDLFVGNL